MIAMTRRNFLLAAALCATSLVGCSQEEPTATGDTNADTTDTANAPATSGNVLVAYYSAQGHTASVAQTIADELGADLFEVTPSEPYSDDDLNWTDDNSRVTREHEDESLRDVALAQVTPDGWEDYDTVLVGYPLGHWPERRSARRGGGLRRLARGPALLVQCGRVRGARLGEQPGLALRLPAERLQNEKGNAPYEKGVPRACRRGSPCTCRVLGNGGFDGVGRRRPRFQRGD